MGVQSKARLARSLFPRWKIFRGDDVMINWGRDKGQTGKVVKVFRKKNRVIVEGRNLVKKTIKRTEQQPGGIITKEAPLHVSNVQPSVSVIASVRVSHMLLFDRVPGVGSGHWLAGAGRLEVPGRWYQGAFMQAETNDVSRTYLLLDGARPPR
eukprot:5270637-Pyramimonas_sp.AAC.2